MTRLKLLFIALLGGSAMLLAGCQKNHATMRPGEANVLGIVEYEQESYEPVTLNTIDASTRELIARRNVQGDKMTLLWGLITVKDY